MRVLHVATRHRRGGAERNLRNIVAWEARRGYEVAVAVGELTEPSDFAGHEVHVVPELRRSLSPATDARALLTLRRLIRNGGFDVVQTHQSKAGITGRMAARGLARVIVHTIHMPSFGPAYSRPASVAFKQAERYAARFTDHFAAVGVEMCRLYADAGILDASRVTVVRAALDVDAFLDLRRRSPGDRAAARTALGLDPDIPVALAVGTLDRRKRFPLVVEQLEPLLQDDAIQIVIAGDGPDRSDVERAARDRGHGRVVVCGHINPVTDAFEAADVLVHASETEGVPQVTVQALAAGMPVVATEMEGLREVGGAEVVVCRRDGADLASAVVATLDAPPAPPLPQAFDEWRTESVDRQLARLWSRIDPSTSDPAQLDDLVVAEPT